LSNLGYAEPGLPPTGSATGVLMENLMLAVQHRLNPLHVYCRLRDLGLERRLSLSWSRSYETLIFKLLLLVTNFFISLCRYTRKKVSHKVPLSLLH
jgi:hypothetical protein